MVIGWITSRAVSPQKKNISRNPYELLVVKGRVRKTFSTYKKTFKKEYFKRDYLQF